MLTRTLAMYMIVGGTLGGAAAGAASGWVVNGWRLSSQVAELRGVVAGKEATIGELRSSNASCNAAVKDVRSAVKAIGDDSARRAKSAAAAMQRVEKKVAGHLADAKGALNRPLPAAGKECEAMVREALDYARRRRAP